MPKNERRFLRRELINSVLQDNLFGRIPTVGIYGIITRVRMMELVNYGGFLTVYKRSI